VSGEQRTLGADITAAIDYLESRQDAVTFSPKNSATGMPFNPGVVVLGHSMGGGAVLQAGINDARVIAVVGVAAAHGGDGVNYTTPPNMLLAIGTADELISPSSSFSLLRTATGLDDAIAGVFYGDFSAGTARQVLLSPGSGHVEEIWDAVIISASINWAENAMGLPLSSYDTIPLQGCVMGMYVSLIGVFILLACIPMASVWVVDRLLELPRKPVFSRTGYSHWKGVVVYFATGVAGGLVGLPLGFAMMGFPIALGGFLTAMFIAWGVLAFVAVLILRRRWKLPSLRQLIGNRQAAGFGFAAALLAFACVYFVFYVLLGTGFVDTTPTPFRWALIALFSTIFFPLALADGWLLWGVALTESHTGTARLAAEGAAIYLASKLVIIIIGMIVVGSLFFFVGAFLAATVVLQGIVGPILYARSSTLVAFAAFNAIWLAYVLAGLLPFMTF